MLEKMRFLYIEYENDDCLFMIDCGKHYEVDASACECLRRTFIKCRYSCRHILLAYVRRRTLTSTLNQLRSINCTTHHILRKCRWWMTDNTHNFHNYTTISLPRQSEQYIQIQRSHKMHKQQTIEKYGEHFVIMVERKGDNFYFSIIYC